jgi:hypothetical protein
LAKCVTFSQAELETKLLVLELLPEPRLLVPKLIPERRLLVLVPTAPLCLALNQRQELVWLYQRGAGWQVPRGFHLLQELGASLLVGQRLAPVFVLSWWKCLSWLLLVL